MHDHIDTPDTGGRAGAGNDVGALSQWASIAAASLTLAAGFVVLWATATDLWLSPGEAVARSVAGLAAIAAGAAGLAYLCRRRVDW